MAPLSAIPTKHNQHVEVRSRVTLAKRLESEQHGLLDADKRHQDQVYVPINLSSWKQLPLSAQRSFGFLNSLSVESIPEVLLLRLMTRTEMWGPDGEIDSIETPLINPIVGDLLNGTAFAGRCIVSHLRRKLPLSGRSFLFLIWNGCASS